MKGKFTLQFTGRFDKEFGHLPKTDAARVAKAIEALEDGLSGDIKKLTNAHPAYRLRVGDYRVLFDLEGTMIDVRSVRHRREAYR